MRLISLADLAVTSHSLVSTVSGEDRTSCHVLAHSDALFTEGLLPRLEGYQ
jgi:hypothetical protein